MNENPYMTLAKFILPSEMTDYFDCNYSAPIEVSPIGMSDHLTVLQQQELHCISNFRSS